MSEISEREIWDVLHRHLRSIFEGDTETYIATTVSDLALYEWFIIPHRQDALPFHIFEIEHNWAGTGQDVVWRFDLVEPRLQRYGDAAIASYTFMLSKKGDKGVEHHIHNESRVLILFDDGWKVVHVHKSPAGADSF